MTVYVSRQVVVTVETRSTTHRTRANVILFTLNWGNSIGLGNIFMY